MLGGSHEPALMGEPVVLEFPNCRHSIGQPDCLG